jgi:hypothetical protein
MPWAVAAKPDINRVQLGRDATFTSRIYAQAESSRAFALSPDLLRVGTKLPSELSYKHSSTPGTTRSCAGEDHKPGF